MSAEQATEQRSARERILSTAYGLFTRRGVRGVGVDEIIARSGVAKATLYRHFRSKDELVLAFLDRREQEWTTNLIDAESRRRGSTPEGQLLAIFDVLDDWFHAPDFDGPSFISVLLEMGADTPVGQASIRHLAHLRSVVRAIADEAGISDPDTLALAWHILIEGSIILAKEGDLDAARHAKRMAAPLIDAYREPAG